MLFLPVEKLLPSKLKRGERAVMEYLLSPVKKTVHEAGAGEVIQVRGLDPV